MISRYELPQSPSGKPLLKDSEKPYPTSVFPFFLISLSLDLKVWSGIYILMSITKILMIREVWETMSYFISIENLKFSPV